jgi:hypothetical protein
MIQFTFRFEDESYDAFASRLREAGKIRYRVTTEEGMRIVIYPVSTPVMGQQTLWIQLNKPGEAIKTAEFIQALGEGIQHAGIYKTFIQV